MKGVYPIKINLIYEDPENKLAESGEFMNNKKCKKMLMETLQELFEKFRGNREFSLSEHVENGNVTIHPTNNDEGLGDFYGLANTFMNDKLDISVNFEESLSPLDEEETEKYTEIIINKDLLESYVTAFIINHNDEYIKYLEDKLKDKKYLENKLEDKYFLDSKKEFED